MLLGITKLTAIIAAIIVALSMIPIITESANGENTLEVLVISGQSNAAYRQVNLNVVNEDVPLPTTNVYYYGTASQPIWYGYPSNPTYDETLDSYGIHSMLSNGEWKIGGYEPILAHAISTKSNCDVLIINVAISSATVANLTPNQIGGEYASKVIADALSKVDSKYQIEKIGYMWVQGESNYSTPIDTYIEQFELVNTWYHENGFDICYMVQTRPENSGNAALAQIQICNQDPTVILASTAPATFTVDNGLMEADNLHYTQRGRDIVGADIDAKLALEYHVRDSTLSTMINVIPLVIIIGLILTAIGVLYVRSRDD